MNSCNHVLIQFVLMQTNSTNMFSCHLQTLAHLTGGIIAKVSLDILVILNSTKGNEVI